MKFGLILAFLISSLAEAYELKVATVSGYSKPWILITSDHINPSDLKTGRIHFHGWTQDPKTGAPYHPQYDFSWADSSHTPALADLRKFVEAYGMQREVLQNPERAILIPLSRGHNDEYVELTDIKKFDQIYSNVLIAFSLNEEFKIRSVSAHSGGGKTLSALLSAADQSLFLNESVVARFFDAIYSVEAVKSLEQWLKNKENFKHLKLFSIPGQSPAKYGEYLYSSFHTGESIQILDVDGVAVNSRIKALSNSAWISVFQEQSSPYRFNHWSLVTNLWNY